MPSLAACERETPAAVALTSFAATLVFPLLCVAGDRLVAYLWSSMIVWLPLQFYVIIYYFFAKQRVYLGTFSSAAALPVIVLTLL